MLYILDEPSIGLHARDQRDLLDTLLQLRDMGNTVLVVEHDAETMLAADWLIDLGPGAGIKGGEMVAEGTPAQVMANPHSLTGQYLSGEQDGQRQQPLPPARPRLADPQRGAPVQPEKRRPPASRSASSPASPASSAAASPRWSPRRCTRPWPAA